MRPDHALLVDAAERLAAAGIDNPRLDARLLLAQALGFARGAWARDGIITDPEQDAFDALLARRAAREPLAYIAGVKEFWSLDFDVGPGVLVPRPASETLIEAALEEFPDRAATLEILDLGTGTGCLLIASLREFLQARGLGIDASFEALAFATRNRARHGLEDRCALQLADWSAAEGGAFDLILANPPYIGACEFGTLEPELAYEPRAALDGGADGLDAYRRLAPAVACALKPDGRALIEIGTGQAEPVRALFAVAGLECRRLTLDLEGIPRCLVLGLALGSAKKHLESGPPIR